MCSSDFESWTRDSHVQNPLVLGGLCAPVHGGDDVRSCSSFAHHRFWSRTAHQNLLKTVKLQSEWVQWSAIAVSRAHTKVVVSRTRTSQSSLARALLVCRSLINGNILIKIHFQRLLSFVLPIEFRRSLPLLGQNIAHSKQHRHRQTPNYFFEYYWVTVISSLFILCSFECAACTFQRTDNEKNQQQQRQRPKKRAPIDISRVCLWLGLCVFVLSFPWSRTCWFSYSRNHFIATGHQFTLKITVGIMMYDSIAIQSVGLQMRSADD